MTTCFLIRLQEKIGKFVNLGICEFGSWFGIRYTFKSSNSQIPKFSNFLICPPPFLLPAAQVLIQEE
jgi:hypothetical protein